MWPNNFAVQITFLKLKTFVPTLWMRVVRVAKTICSKKIISSELQLFMSLLYSEVILFYYENTSICVKGEGQSRHHSMRRPPITSFLCSNLKKSFNSKMGHGYIATLVVYNTLYLFSGIKIKKHLKHTQRWTNCQDGGGEH